MNSRGGWLVAILMLSAACGPEPASIRLQGEVPDRIYSLAPVPLPVAQAYDVEGQPISLDVVVGATPKGIVQIYDGVLIPVIADDVTLTWYARSVKHVETIEIRPIDSITLRCSPECKVRVGADIRVQATAHGGGQPLHELDVPLTATGDGMTLKANVVTSTKPGKGTVHAKLGDATASIPIEFYAKPDRVELKCKTVFTKTRSQDGEEFEVCHFTKSLTASVSTRVLSGDTVLPNESVVLKLLDEKIATVAGHDRITPLRTGQTILKASAESDPFVSSQIGIDVGSASAREQLYRARYRGHRRQFGPLGLRGRDQLTVYYSPSCPSWKTFTSKAYVHVPDQDEPEELYCGGTRAISCIAEASAALWMKGRMATKTMRDWLGPCCCVTSGDRQELEAQEVR